MACRLHLDSQATFFYDCPYDDRPGEADLFQDEKMLVKYLNRRFPAGAEGL
jgi:hypothetical protein